MPGTLAGNLRYRYYTTTTAAEYLQAHPNSIRSWVKTGQLAAIHTPFGRLFTREMLHRFIRDREESGKPLRSRLSRSG